MNQEKLSLYILLLFLSFHSCICIDTITSRNSIKDGDILVSSGQGFALGFFSPAGNPARRYVGIWYNKVTEKTVVWVANRDNPINDTSGVLAISSKGNLVLYGHNQTIPVWSANVSLSSLNKNNSIVQLLETGNLLLLQQDSNTVLWQSFDHPTDTMLPYMKLGLDRKTGKNWFLSSWKSKDDPGTGNIFYRIDPTGYPQLFLYKGSLRWWRGGPWTGQRWSGVPEMTRNYIFNASFVNTEDEVFITYGLTTNATIFSRMMVNESGTVQRATWNDRDGRWIGFWSAPKEPCDNYGECGANSNCDPYDSDNFICKCLPGFYPKSPGSWYLRDGSDGCNRKAGVSTCRDGEGFVRLALVKVPDTATARVNMSLSLKACEQECLRNCSCTAYTSAYESGIGCLTWYGDLVDIRTYSSVGQDIYVRVDAVELAKYGKSKSRLTKGVQAILIASVSVASFLAVFVVYCLVKKRRKARDRRRSKSLFSFTQSPTDLGDSHGGKGNDEDGIPDLPFFDLSAIATATSNFSDDNKLGEGGFGSVYKGLLHGGKEIAVKRLSRYSGQGTEEFKNEVALIAKLQHRNLVRMIGYCVQEPEKMLIYEYLPNKSLDSFIFDEAKRSLLDWSIRHSIICGIARGILYLHQDSRLRIIHRDLKASNVLLDASMNPKISDFGMARIVGVDQIEANTNRVVGTYGYMSPEYAMQGLFSVKSDVYSFGVLLIEIITGRKNSSFYEESTSSNLVGYVWDLWREGRALEIVDISLGDAYPEHEVLRCIQIGLLCVQESAVDRPAMTTVVFMLSNHTILPSPNQPAFIMKRSYNSGEPVSASDGGNSVNEVTMTVLEAR
ncbi:G-type lectin S-receptor-like serine/threonine-protein kinase At1g11410 isoform X1 [Ricinus communis]|uniref:G-type lectin S-receptor-like serine/threonine-protein kinase At1g11410 isoform X1 n=1 Tax=Ricinus communis TaxID=3988 RepID=UPI00201A3142|nr:G-type lectin S-receptor-like serine/threonine-protein kinase At1g11410 isoform X1 [Ricinus communis]